MNNFRSVVLAQKWANLHKQRQQLAEKKQSTKNDLEIDVISSIMTSCKKGFSLTDAKIKKIIKFLREQTGKDRIKYGEIPENVDISTALYKDITIKYAEKDGFIIFRENIKK
jgi:hypothetical protein